MVVTVIRALFFYFFLILIMRLMGKRQLGEMELSELVTTVLLSELAVLPVTDTDIPIFHGIFPLLIISSLEVVISFLSQRSRRFRNLVYGRPMVLYEKGSFVRQNLLKTRISVDDVETQVRINGLEGMKQVSRVILERTGKMSVLPKSNLQTNQGGE